MKRNIIIKKLTSIGFSKSELNNMGNDNLLCIWNSPATKAARVKHAEVINLINHRESKMVKRSNATMANEQRNHTLAESWNLRWTPPAPIVARVTPQGVVKALAHKAEVINRQISAAESQIKRFGKSKARVRHLAELSQRRAVLIPHLRDAVKAVEVGS